MFLYDIELLISDIQICMNLRITSSANLVSRDTLKLKPRKIATVRVIFIKPPTVGETVYMSRDAPCEICSCHVLHCVSKCMRLQDM